MTVQYKEELVAEQYIGTNIHDIIDFIDGWNHSGLRIAAFPKDGLRERHIKIFLELYHKTLFIEETNWVLWDAIHKRLWVETDENFRKYYQEVPN